MSEWNGKATYSVQRRTLTYWATLNRFDVIPQVSTEGVARFLLAQLIADGSPNQPLEIEGGK